MNLNTRGANHSHSQFEVQEGPTQVKGVSGPHRHRVPCQQAESQ